MANLWREGPPDELAHKPQLPRVRLLKEGSLYRRNSLLISPEVLHIPGCGGKGATGWQAERTFEGLRHGFLAETNRQV